MCKVEPCSIDFIFTVFSSHFGFIGSALLISLLTYFDIRMILIALKTNKLIDKYNCKKLLPNTYFIDTETKL